MKKLADLNFEIENILGLKIEYNASVQNFKYNGYWVTDIQTNFFLKKNKKLERLLEKNINYDKKRDILFLKQMYEEVKGIYQRLIEKKYDEFSSFLEHKNDWDYDLTYPNNPPLLETDDVQLPNPANEFDDRQEYIEEFVVEFTKLFLESEKGKETNEENIKFIQELKRTYGNKENEGEKLGTYDQELIYAKAHLSYIISLHMELVRSVGLMLKKLVEIIDKLENFDKNDENTSDSILENPNQIKLEFAMKKQDIAILFNSLHELGIIKTDTDDIYDSQKKLKKFIDNANLYYTFNKKLTKVDNIKKEFTPLNNKEINDKEIDFLENIISKFKTRIQEINARES